MVPPEFTNFFLGSVGASATLIGLLFIAVSIEPRRVFGREAPAEHQATAAGAFTALANVFFVSLGALIPTSNLGGFILVASTIALLNTLSVGQGLLRQLRHRQIEGRRAANAVIVVLIGFVIYGFEWWYGLSLGREPQYETYYLTALTYLLVGVFGFGLVRAWELLGARRRGLLAWLIFSRDPDETNEREAGGSAPPVERKSEEHNS
jgi:hypothetical protein